jgi:hypothetical protein
MKKSRPQINVTLSDAQIERVEKMVQRYGKKDKSRVLLEIFEQYVDLYEHAEEAKFEVLQQQKLPLTVGKSPGASKRVGPKRQAS